MFEHSRCYHGSIIWAYRALHDIPVIGGFLCFFNSVMTVISMGSDIPIYVSLMSWYVNQFVTSNFGGLSMTFWTLYLLKLVFIAIGGICAILNVKSLGNLSILCSLVIMAPFIVGFVFSAPNIDISTWTDTTVYNDDDEPQWGVFLSMMLWVSSGWDTVGSFMAELEFDKSRIFGTFAAAMILVYLSYTLPILGALTEPCDEHCWDDGYLYTAYDRILPNLGIFIIIAGFVCNFTIYIGEMAVQSRQLWALSQPMVILLPNGQMFTQGHGGILYDDEMNAIGNNEFAEMERDLLKEHRVRPRQIRVGILPQWLCGTIWNKTGAPVRGVALQSLVSAGMVLLDFETLVQGMALVSAVAWFLEFSAFIVLRYTEPDAPRPFKVLGGLWLAWLITIDKMLLIGSLVIIIIYQSPSYLYLLCVVVVGNLIWYALYRRCQIEPVVQNPRIVNNLPFLNS